jgi:CubicO group peptidase (beta-lactamase class C family)
VDDLNRFAAALQAHTLLDAEHTELMITPKPGPSSRASYGYGFGSGDLEGHRCFGYNGGAPGMNGSLNICPKDGYVIAVLSNLDPPVADRIAQYVAARLPIVDGAGP